MGPQPEHQVPWILDLGLQALGWGLGAQGYRLHGAAGWGLRAHSSKASSCRLQAACAGGWGLVLGAAGSRLSAPGCMGLGEGSQWVDSRIAG